MNYNQPQEHSDQPVNLEHLNPSEKHGYPDNLPQLNNVGLQQKLDDQSLNETPQYLNEPQEPSYGGEVQQPINRGILFFFQILVQLIFLIKYLICPMFSTFFDKDEKCFSLK